MKATTANYVALLKEPVIQFGFLAMFGWAMPLSVFFALLCNSTQIFISFNYMFAYGRRVMPNTSDGIGPW